MLLTKNCETGCTVLIRGGAAESEVYAAEELRRFVRETTGAEMPLRSFEEGPAFGEKSGWIREIRLGAFSGDPSLLNRDGFLIRTRGNVISIEGASERGTIYGVYELLERAFGVVFLTREDTYIPKREEVTWEEGEIREVPAFSIRSGFAAPIIEDPAFAARLRMFCPYGKNEARYGYGYLHEWYNNELHSFMDLLPLKEYYPKHPEWYAKEDERAWLCLTNGITDGGELDLSMQESVARTVIEKLKLRIRERPEVKYFMVGQEDSFSECECERCTAAKQRNGNLTGNLMVFINCVAREIRAWAEKEFPGREIYIVTFSYQKTLFPPVKRADGTVLAPGVLPEGRLTPVHPGVVPEANVYVFYAASSLCYMHEIGQESCSWNRDIGAQIEGWKAITDRFMVWDYGTNFDDFLWYFPNMNRMKNNLKTYRSCGAVLALNQTAPREWRYYDMQSKLFVTSRLMWNLDQDVWQLFSQFNRLWLGERAGKHADEYLRIMEEHFAKLDAESKGTFHTDLYHNFEHTFDPKNFPIEVLRRAEGEILAAMAETEGDEALSREEKDKLLRKLKMMLIQPQNMILRNYDSYYETGKKEFASAFIRTLEELEFWYYGESYSKNRENMKKELGV